MKLSAIQQICKGAKRIELYAPYKTGTQWISDGGAFYPLYNLPFFEDESVFTFFDIPEKKRNKITLTEHDELPATFDFADRDSGENLLKQGNISICAGGRTLIPLHTSLGTVYINAKYLTPFKDSEVGVQLYERNTPSGAVYIAVKEGFLLTGIILPFDIVTKDFIKELEALCKGSAIAEENKKSLRSITENAYEQTEIEDDPES